MQKPTDIASSAHLAETLTAILSLDYVQEAKIMLLAMVVMNKTVAHITDIANVMNAPLVDVDFGRVALTAERANKAKSFDIVHLSDDWIEKYVPSWFAAINSEREDDSNRKQGDSEGDHADIKSGPGADGRK